MLQAASQNSDLSGLESDFDVELHRVFKVFNGETAVRGVEVQIRRGDIFLVFSARQAAEKPPPYDLLPASKPPQPEKFSFGVVP